MMLLENRPTQLELLQSVTLEFPPSETRKIETVSIAGRTIGVTPVFSAYWQFATERQKIFFKRLQLSNSIDFTSDPVLARFKFTNTYRASDRVSQYLIQNVIYRDDMPKSDDEVFFRVLLFKIFNKIETWEFLENAFGELTLAKFNYSAFSDALALEMAGGRRIYSAAYIMPSAGSVFGYKSKHENHLALLNSMLEDRFPERLKACETMADSYDLMLSAPSFGPFLAYQYATDLNYSEITNFDESEFVVAGPGALDGIRKCFSDLGNISADTVIRHMYENQEKYFKELSLNFKSLWGRPLQLIDCQNIFCEISKYARVAFPDIDGVSGRKRIKQKYSPKGKLLSPWYPPKWNINQKIQL